MLGAEVDDVRARGRGHGQAGRLAVDGDHLLRPEQPRAPDRELPHRPASPHGHHVAVLDLAVLRGHVAGGKDVGQEENLLVAQPGRDLQWAHVRERYAHHLRLPARVATHHV